MDDKISQIACVVMPIYLLLLIVGGIIAGLTCF
jgi:hypothetical protein